MSFRGSTHGEEEQHDADESLAQDKILGQVEAGYLVSLMQHQADGPRRSSGSGGLGADLGAVVEFEVDDAEEEEVEDDDQHDGEASPLHANDLPQLLVRLAGRGPLHVAGYGRRLGVSVVGPALEARGDKDINAVDDAAAKSAQSLHRAKHLHT